jgi:serine/threonine protein kinase
LTPEEYQRVSDIFAAACELEDGKRAAFLDEACAGDTQVRARVESMLRSDANGEAFMRDAALNLRGQVEEALGEGGPADSIPLQIGRYRIIRKLGDGGMGVVYLAEQDQPRRCVAVKVIRTGFMSRDMLRRFEFEAQVLGQLRHPGIAHIYESGTADTDRGEQSYFAMEYVEGPRLDRYAGENQLDTRQRLKLMALICEAVQHAHQKGVIHRDLKPGNILVDESGQPKVLDFGVARATNADTHIVTMQTNAGQLIGTIPYMSPEQVSGVPSEIDTRSDVYALGVICFELLTQRLPHQLRDRSIPEAARIIRDQEPSRLGSINPALRGDLETIVAKALEKDRSRRYQSAAELSADIGRYLRNEPILARPQTTLYQLRKFARRNRGLALALCGVLLALMAGLASTLIYAFREHQQRQVAERRFEDLRSFSHNVIVDYQNMQREKGETQARKYLTSLAQKYLDMLVGESSDLNPKAQADLATAYAVIGDVLGQPNSANLGDPMAALANYEKSIAITEELAHHDPDNIELQRNLAIRYERAGNVHLFEQNREKALAYYEKSHAIKFTIAGKDPDGQRNLSFSYNKLGDVYIKINRKEEAHDMYVKSLDIRKRLADLSPKNEGIQREYMVGLNRVGDVLMELGRKEEALERYEASLARRIELAALQPDNTRARMDVAVGHFKRGDGLAALDRADEALAAYRMSRSILRDLAKTDPSNTTARLGAAEMSGQIGKALLKSGRAEAALAEFTEQTQEIEAAIPEEKLSVSQRQLLAEGHQLRGQTLLKLASDKGNTPLQSREFHAKGCAALRHAKELFLARANGKVVVPQELVDLLTECESAVDAQ